MLCDGILLPVKFIPMAAISSEIYINSCCTWQHLTSSEIYSNVIWLRLTTFTSSAIYTIGCCMTLFWVKFISVTAVWRHSVYFKWNLYQWLLFDGIYFEWNLYQWLLCDGIHFEWNLFQWLLCDGSYFQ